MSASSKEHTKKWRKEQKWYKNGKLNECETYQIEHLLKNMKIGDIKKCNDRINAENNVIDCIPRPYIYENGYEYSENFDRKMVIGGITYYFNLKFVCGSGGAQTRTLKNVYDFVKNQMNILRVKTDIIFINIFDGDESYRNMNKFEYLMNKKENRHLVAKCYVGDMRRFENWYAKLKLIQNLNQIFAKDD